MILHVVLQHLVVVILNFLARDATNFGELVRLVVGSFGHRDLVLRVQRHLLMRTLKLGHEGRGQGRLSFLGLRHRREVLRVTDTGV